MRGLTLPRESLGSVIHNISLTSIGTNEEFLSEPELSSQFFSQDQQEVGILVPITVSNREIPEKPNVSHNAQVMPDSYYIETSGDVSNQDSYYD